MRPSEASRSKTQCQSSNPQENRVRLDWFRLDKVRSVQTQLASFIATILLGLGSPWFVADAHGAARTMKAEVKRAQEGTPLEELEKWWNQYRRGRFESFFSEEDLFRVRGAPPGRPASGKNRAVYRTINGYREKSWTKPRETNAKALAEFLRGKMEQLDGSVSPKVESYVNMLEVFERVRKEESLEAISELLDITIECTLASSVPNKKTSKWSRPQLVAREATLAILRSPFDFVMRGLELRAEMIEANMSGRTAPVLWAHLFNTLRTFLQAQKVGPGAMDRASELCLARFKGSGAMIGAGTLRFILSQKNRPKLSAEALATSFSRLDEAIKDKEDELVSVMLQALGFQPQESVLLGLAQRLANERKSDSELGLKLRDTLSSMAPSRPEDESDPGAWLAWYEKEKHTERFQQWMAAQWADRPDSESEARYAKVTRFYGVPIVGHRVVFVIDVSGSMGFPLRKGDSEPKMTQCRQELTKVVEALADTTEFNFITFDSQVRVWNKKPVAAKKARRAALKFVDELRPGSATNLYGALRQAFGRGKAGRPTTGASIFNLPDQVIVLSDGVPTAGEVIEGGEILTQVGMMNAVGHTRIDTIAFGTDADRDFLKALAEIHGGNMVAYPKKSNRQSLTESKSF